MGARGTLWSVTTRTPTSGSTLSAPQTSSQSSGTTLIGLAHPDLALSQKMSGCTLSALAEPWPRTSPGSQIDYHVHQSVALDRIHGINPTTYLILQREFLSAHEPTTLFSTPWLSTKATKQPTRTFPDPGPVRLTERHHFSDRPTTTPYDRPSTSPSQFPTKILPNHPARVHLKSTTKTPSKSPIRGPSKFSDLNFFQISQKIPTRKS